MNLKRSAAMAATTLALTASVAGAASAAPAPTRNGNAPLTHYSGWHRLADASGHDSWSWTSPDSDATITLGGGVWMEVDAGGRCTDPATGRLVVGHLRHVGRCG